MKTTVLAKLTHVFLKTPENFTSIAKRAASGTHRIYTDMPLTAEHADAIDALYSNQMQVQEINLRKGFLFIRLKKGFNYNHIVNALKFILHGER